MFRDELGNGLDFHGRCRKVGHVPVTHLVTGRDGRSYPRVGTDPRGHDGRCRGLSRGSLVPRLLFRGTGGTRADRNRGSGHVPLRRGSCLRADGHQASAGLLHDLADRFHDGSPRCFRDGRTRRLGLHGIHVPPLHARHV